VHIPISSIEVQTKDEILFSRQNRASEDDPDINNTVIGSIWFVIGCLQTYNNLFAI